jgi:pimeloyl-ACP methyl ester carboxylesterase
VSFPGFNQFPLKGTVLAAQGSPFFAVLVADAGPLDRDWQGPRLASHGGRTLALWLRDQGIGSLRFDKRLANARDPHLNTSLDAQAGDLKAALEALRDLPEAKGRKVLVVGHGEGALLALMAAQKADALLLLGMPSQSQAKAIAAQIGPQLPAEKAAPNLAHLEATFQAIREGGPTPTPGPDVYPALARLCVSLMAPETLDFVRATLDLDPWAMAARVVVPMAAAWGDRDVQAFKPAVVPAAFPGTVLEIPDANHLLKREPRAKSQLDPESALSRYGDDSPLADLTLLEVWLKGLR